MKPAHLLILTVLSVLLLPIGTRAQDPGWVLVSPDSTWHVYSLEVLDGDLVAAATDSGLFLTSDAGLTWSASSTPELPLAVSGGPGDLAIARSPIHVMLSEDAGDTWALLTNPASGLVTGVGMGPDSTLYFGTYLGTMGGGGLYASPDFGLTWRPVLVGQTVVLHGVGSEGSLFATSNDYAIRSTDGGVTWDSLRVPGPYAVNDAFVAPDGRAWIAAGSELYVIDSGWNTAELVEDFDSGVSHLYLDRDGRLYAMSGLISEGMQLWASDDEGAHWAEVPVPMIGSISGLVETLDGDLLLGTGSGLYRGSRVAGPIPAPSPDDADDDVERVVGVYPNPVSALGRIVVTASTPGDIRLDVFDVLGRTQLSSALQVTGSGPHEFVFDVEGWPPGVYVYRVQAGRWVASRKLTVVR